MAAIKEDGTARNQAMTSVAHQLAEPKQENISPTITKILNAAEQEFAEAGFDAAKMECIARRADISKQLVYHYFGSKTGLYGEVLRNIARANHEALLTIDYENLTPVAAVQACLISLISIQRASQEIRSLMIMIFR